MRFISIDPLAHEISFLHAETFDEALAAVGLSSGDIDIEGIASGLSIAVYEYGLKDRNPRTKEAIPPQVYFALGDSLYAGRAVIYAYNTGGETIDIATRYLSAFQTFARWYANKNEVEAGIARGEIRRPQQTITTYDEDRADTIVTWRWNQPMAAGASA